MSNKNEVGDFIFKAVAPWAVREALEFVQVPQIFVEAAVFLTEVALDEDE